jgi:hypothetical protein
MQFILDQIPSFDQFTSAAAGYALGILTAIWAHALWKWWHPHTIRYWGAWYTNPRILFSGGLALTAAWIAFLLKSLW